jgi:protein TonB
MFDDLVESSVVRKKTNKGLTVFISTIVQCVILFVLVLIPLIYTQALPKAMLTTLLVAPPPPPPPPPPPAEAPKVIIKPVARLITQGKLMQPRAIPKQVAVFKEAELPPEPPAGSGGGVLGGLDGGLLGGLGGGSTAAAPPPPPKGPSRIKLGGSVQEAKIVARPNPTYPALARQARIQGNVVLHAVIDKEGKVSELQVVSGHPLLVQSALDAVKNWRYQPTLLNGDPVEVETTITVSFVLGG